MLFTGLFVVNHALQRTGVTAAVVADLAASGRAPGASPAPLFAATLVLSNVVSNVPAVMLLLPVATHATSPGPMLALVSTLAGNLLIVGSIANIIVVDAAARRGHPDRLAHARAGGRAGHRRHPRHRRRLAGGAPLGLAHGIRAKIRVGPPLPPTTLMGATTTVKPVAGRAVRLVALSM